MGGQVAAVAADGVDFGDVLGYGQQLANGAEGAAFEVHVQPGDDDALAPAGQFLGVSHDGFVEELGLVQSHDGGGVRQVEQHGGVGDGRGFKGVALVADDLGFGVAGVDGGFKDLDVLAGNARPLEAADQLLGLAGEHGPADDFQPAPPVFGAAAAGGVVVRL